MRKIIFLDLDGVLNTLWWEKKEHVDKYGYAFDPNAVANLAKIIEETGAEIVISSSWKFMGLSEMQDMWEVRGLPGKIIDITPNTVSDEMLLSADLDHMELMPIRGMEIKEWLEKKGKKVSQYAILDDMDAMLPEQKSHFVQTNPNVGITEDDAFKAISILNHLEH